jgi:predicted unusual protein kinase regulating ubiquinone biosynthesis (AarF/ABC1/UbiB family)
MLDEYSTKRVLTMELCPGVRADFAEVQSLSQERRNRLGLLFLELYLRELLEFKSVQTDPHLGNYLIQIDPAGANDKLVLLDFGAVRDVPEDFLKNYRLVIEGGISKDERLIEKAGRLLGLLQPEDGIELVKDYVELCLLLVEPFDGVYDWGASDLPKRVAARVGKIATSYRLRAPPRELVFLDRKLGGVFIFLSVLKCKVDARPIVLEILNRTK